MTPLASAVRYRVDPGDVPEEKAARRLHLTVAQFRDALPRLLERGFPPADPDTGMFDLEAIDAWRRARHPRLLSVSPVAEASSRAQLASTSSMGDRFREAQERKRRDRAA